MKLIKMGGHRMRPGLMAAAVWLAMGVAPGQAEAQYFSASGAVGSWPVDLFPINGALDFLDFTAGNAVTVGAGAPGSFAAQAGGLLVAGGLTVGSGGLGQGTVTLADPGTRFDLIGNVNRLDVGSWGTGSLTLSAGAAIDARRNISGCLASGACNSFVGNAAGSTGTFTITGVGSQASLIRNFGVGHVAVFTSALNGFDFGTPGGFTSGVVNVLAGGSLDTQVATIGRGPSQPAALGTEQGHGSVVVDGPGSRWRATRNTIDNIDAFVGIGNGAGGHGAVTVRNGGQMVVDGTGGNPIGFTVINLGINGGHGALTVSGIGSSLQVAGINPIIQAGRSGAGASGSFNVLAGASAAAMFVNVGRDGATGNLLVDGTGTQLTLAGVASVGSGSGPAFMHVGRNGGQGQATISGGARVTITDNGGDSRPSGFSPGVVLGRGADALGTMTISGAGSVLEVIGNSLGVAPGDPDNINPFFAVGFDNPGTTSGDLTVSAGARLLLTGRAVSNASHGRSTTFNVGGHGTTAARGVATLTGAGSEIVVGGYDALVNVGRGAGSNGTLSILDQARLASISMVVGHGGSGTANLDNARVDLAGYRTDSSNVGAGATVGRDSGGTGALNLSNNARLVITNDTLAGGLSIGGDSFYGGGSGAVMLSGGSSIRLEGSLPDGAITVGRTGTGLLDLSGASTVDVGNTRAVHVGRAPGAIGTLNVAGGSSVRAGTIHFGGDNDDTAGGTAIGRVTGAGSLLQASGASGFIAVGRGGAGTLTVDDRATLAATGLNVGRAAGGVGTFTADNAVLQMTGQRADGIGASFSVGNRGGSGNATLRNGTQLTLSNAGSGGVSLNVGGTPINPGGTGDLQVIDSQIRLEAAPGLARMRVGHDGSGTAGVSGSTIDLGDGALVVAGVTGSTGRLTVSNGSVVNAGYVGVSASPSGPGGDGHLILNNSVINTTTLEIGAQGILSGDGGIINASGDVILAGLINPGNSPGRVTINCNIITLPGSRIVLDVQANASGGYDVDRLIIGNESSYNLSQAEVVVNFLGATNPLAFAASGGFDLDTFIRQGVDNVDVGGLSSDFASGVSWTDVVSAERIVARSEAYVVTELVLRADGGFNVSAAPVPEPSTWATLALGLLGVGAMARAGRRRPRR